MPKKLKADPLRFFNIHSVGKYQKIEGDPSGNFFSKSHRAENTLREYPLAPLSFLDDVKILRKQEFMTHENCKKSGPFRVRLLAKKTPTVIVGLFSLREKAPNKNTTKRHFILVAFFFMMRRPKTD